MEFVVSIKPCGDELDEAVENMGRENDLQHAWDEVAPLTENQDAIDEDLQMDNDAAEPYDIGQDLGLPAQVMADSIQTITVIPDEEYRRQMRTLNRKQSEFVMDVLHHAKTSDEPICRFLSGGAGVGKTHVTTLLYQSLYRYLNKRPGVDPDKPCILLMAPTGKAAYLIRGNTLHSALKIPVNQKLQYKSLDTDSLNTLRTQMMGVKYVTTRWLLDHKWPGALTKWSLFEVYFWLVSVWFLWDRQTGSTPATLRVQGILKLCSVAKTDSTPGPLRCRGY